MRKAFLIRVIPNRQLVIGFNTDISPRTMQRLLKSEKIRNGALCAIPKMGLLRYARADRPREEYRLLARWQLGDTTPVEGEAIIFGVNEAGKAAASPVGADWIRSNITWLPPFSQIGGILLAQQ